METFTYKVRICYKDTDAGGIVYHANYLALAEQARTHWQLLINDKYANRAMLSRKEAFVIRDVHLEYFHPTLLDDEITIVCNALKLDAASGTFYQEFLRGDEKLAALTIKVVMINTETGRPMRMPQDLKEGYEKYLLPAGKV